MIRHRVLKIRPAYLNDIRRDVRTFLVEFNDKDYKIGDVLELKAFRNKQYFGKLRESEFVEVIYVSSDCMQLMQGNVILGIKRLIGKGNHEQDQTV